MKSLLDSLNVVMLALGEMTENQNNPLPNFKTGEPFTIETMIRDYKEITIKTYGQATDEDIIRVCLALKDLFPILGEKNVQQLPPDG